MTVYAGTATPDSRRTSPEVSEWLRRIPDDAPDIPRMRFDLGRPSADALETVVYWPTARPLLADVTELFEHLGLRVADRTDLPRPSGLPETAALQAFSFRTRVSREPAALARIEQAFEAHFAHDFRVDDYAILISTTGLSWRDTLLVRAASRFLRQVGLGFSEKYVIETLTRHSGFVTALVAYFAARFDPDLTDRDKRAHDARERVQSFLESVSTLDDDRILRAFESFVTGCVRTNWFQLDGEKHKAYSAFKLDSAKLTLSAAVVPYREIFVHAGNVEGIHARAGRIARGGIRFSDRPEDYRTEVLGLMKTQTVKNSPIVPVGAKGVFVRTHPETTPAEAYSVFIRGLLDVTDNLIDNRPVAPPRTVTYDDADSYLVVAADKGTATFSDLANSIAKQYDYWLGDAFASGGSSGYDHKAMGITARGAWLAVRRHFEQLGVDVDRDRIRVVGIGDMSGDVFGNGMLLSSSIHLVAAFDHRHIIIDPDPDPAHSFAERGRLFRTSGSDWSHFDSNALSEGGGIWSRSAVKIELSERARAAIGADRTEFSPNELVQAILTAPVDLLWNGGIGTYVKSSSESHADAADPANDAVRVDADRLRCKVVGEGGNIGLTQPARVEYALHGGRINADFIDNAAGVATSDLEVNLKIGFGPEHPGTLDHIQRGQLLTGARDDVAATVLQNIENQTLAIDLAEWQAPRLLDRHARLSDHLEHSNGIDRSAVFLPTQPEVATRARTGRGLTRPEIAVLLALSKCVVREDLLASTVPDDPSFLPALRAYFPDSVAEAIPERIRRHRLGREIIATRIADDLINHVGPGLIYRFEERLGARTPDVARAYAVVREVFDVDNLWAEAHARTDSDAAQRFRLLSAVQQFIEQAASWLLRRRPGPLDVSAEIARYRPGVAAVLDAVGNLDLHDNRLGLLAETFELVETARTLACSPVVAAELFIRTSEVLDLGWIVGRLRDHAPATRWESMGAAAIRDAISDTHHRLVGTILAVDANLSAADSVQHWQKRAVDAVRRFTELTAEIRHDGSVDVARACTMHAELALLTRNSATTR